ncbi:hypothetical protein GCM10009714_22680 [Microlunatus capsulatus]
MVAPSGSPAALTGTGPGPFDRLRERGPFDRLRERGPFDELRERG